MTYEGEVTNLWTFAEWWVALNVGVVAMRMCLTGLQLQGPAAGSEIPLLWAYASTGSSQPKTKPWGDCGRSVPGRPRTALMGSVSQRTSWWPCGSILRLRSSPGHRHQLLLPPSSVKESIVLHHTLRVLPDLPCSPHFYRCFPYKVFANPTLGQELKWVANVCRATR